MNTQFYIKFTNLKKFSVYDEKKGYIKLKHNPHF